MCLLARTSSNKSAFLFLCFPGFREEPFFCGCSDLLWERASSHPQGRGFISRKWHHPPAFAPRPPVA
ncbi:hypothetical protein C1X61_14680 [Pseudomonas sp. FW215-T2]|nr:hypothetical protein C1X61_14680 [Pseudomonas sp. FW215-T2]PNA10006.1 hypothetical protein C1X62_20030 [Pseudomonas sp. FW215-R3]PNB36192.1 hypothetical protein C1X63_19195 [Pseudomonas sp. FW305-131]